MKFDEIIAPSMKDLFIENIENMILTGQLKIGDKLPTERELAKQMKISRTIVNLGLNELQEKGFVDIIPRNGTYISNYKKNGNLKTLYSIIDFENGKFDEVIFNSIMQFRIINESESAYFAAQNRTDEDIKNMEKWLKIINNEPDDKKLAEDIFELHHIVFCSTGNCIYPLVHNAFKNIAISLTTNAFNFYSKEIFLQELDHMIYLIKAREADMAKKTMIRMLNTCIQEFQDNYFKS